MPHLQESCVDVNPDLTVTYVSNPGSEMARWSNSGAKWDRCRVLVHINDELARLDERRRELDSARLAVMAIPYEFGTPTASETAKEGSEER